MDERDRDMPARQGVFLPDSQERARVSNPRAGVDRTATSARTQRQTAVEVRGYGGRRLGFKVDGNEQAKLEAIDRHLFNLAQRAIKKGQ